MTAVAGRVDGQGRSEAPSPQEILQRETREEPVPPVLLEESYQPLGDADLPSERYLSREVHELEVEKVWRKVWQMACREDDIPNVGDCHVYSIADDSVILVRTGPETIKGYVNACLHRGTQLAETDGNVG